MRGLGEAPGGKEALSTLGAGLTEVAAQTPLGGILNVGDAPQSVQDAGALGQEAYNTFDFLPGVRAGAKTVDFLNELGQPYLDQQREFYEGAQQRAVARQNEFLDRPIPGTVRSEFAEGGGDYFKPLTLREIQERDKAAQQQRIAEFAERDAQQDVQIERIRKMQALRQIQRDREEGVDPRIANEQISTGQFGENVFEGGTTGVDYKTAGDDLSVEERVRRVEEKRARDQAQLRRMRGYDTDSVADPQEVTQKDQPQTGVTQEEPSTSVSTTEFGTSYYEIQDPNSDQSVSLPASRNPHDNSFVPMDSQEITPNMIGEAAVANSEYRSGIQNIANIAVEAGMNNPVFQELIDAESSLDIQRSDFPAGRGGDTQFKQAQGQARRAYGRLAKRVMRQAPNVFEAQGRKKVTGERELESETDEVLRIADQIMTESARDPYGEPMSQDRAVAMAMQRRQQGKQMRSRVQGMLRPGQSGIPSQQLQTQQPQQRQGLPSGAISSQQIPDLNRAMEQYDLGYGLSATSEGIGVITSGNNAFIATSVPNYPVPVAFARNAQEEQLAKSLGIPVVSRNNPEVRGGRTLKPAKPGTATGRGDTTRRRSDFGTEGLDERSLQIEAIEQAEEDFDTAYKSLIAEQSGSANVQSRREDYYRLARMYQEEMGIESDPNVDPVLDRDPGFAQWIKQQEIENDPDSMPIIERANLKDGMLPQQSEPTDNAEVDKLRQIYDTQTTGYLNRRTDRQPSRESLRQAYIGNRVTEIFSESVAKRSEQQRILDDISGTNIQRQMQNAYGEPANYGNRREVTLQRTPGVYQPKPVLVRNDGNIEIETVEQIVDTAMGLPFFYQGRPITLNKQRLEDATEEVIRKPGIETSGNRKVYDTAVVAVAEIIQEAFPNEFPANNAGLMRLTEISKNMLRRLGYLTENDLLGY